MSTDSRTHLSVLPVRLSQREMEVLRLVVAGLSTKQVAARLGISFRTAACHRSSVMQKLDVHETASLVRKALESGLVPLNGYHNFPPIP